METELAWGLWSYGDPSELPFKLQLASKIPKMAQMLQHQVSQMQLHMLWSLGIAVLAAALVADGKAGALKIVVQIMGLAMFWELLKMVSSVKVFAIMSYEILQQLRWSCTARGGNVVTCLMRFQAETMGALI